MVDVPHDAVAIFHCSFHPTRGNVVDWSLKASDDVDLTNVEFSCLPSGLHTIEEDIVYFSRGDHPGLCVFRRRRTEEHGHRGYRLSSLGILLAAPTTSASSSSTSTSTTSQPKPWLHAPSLKLLVQTIYSSLENRDILEPTERDWEPARAWFEQNKLPSLTTTPSESSPNHLTTPITIPTSVPDPSTHLPHILQASSLGPSLLTISRFLLARRRVLILTKPPVEGACVMCWAIGGLCATEGVDAASSASTSAQLADTEGPRVLGMVTLHDIDRLERSGKASVTQSQGHGRGWIACTTDSVFVDKTKCWDLLVDVTSCEFSALASQAAVGGQGVSGGEGRPKMYVPKGSLDGDMGDRAGKSGKKEGLRFAWSDVKLWTDLARLAPVPGVPNPASTSSHSHTHSHSHASSSSLSSPSSHRPPPGPSSLPLNLVPPSWLDANRIYEDACILCAGMWYSSSPSWQEEGQGRIRLNGDDSLATPTYDKSKSMSVDHGRRRSPSGDSRADSTAHGSKRVERVFRRMSESSTAVFTSRTWAGKGKLTEEPVEISALDVDGSEEDFETFRANAAASVSRAFAAYHSRLLQRLCLLVEESSVGGGQSNDLGLRTVMLSPRDLASLDLGPLSVIDARWIEWLSDSHPGVVGGGAGESRRGRTVVRVRRARWRDVLGAVFGFS